MASRVGYHRIAMADDVDFLISATDALRNEIRQALGKYPESDSIRWPFHSAYRPFEGQSATPDQQAAIDWRHHLADRNEKLRTHFIWVSRGAVLDLFPLSGFGFRTNFGYQISSEQAIEMLGGESELLRKERQSSRRESASVLLLK